jgi:hypothetical protein
MKNYNYDETLGRLNLEKMRNSQSNRKLTPSETDAIFWGYEDLINEMNDKKKIEELAKDKKTLKQEINRLAVINGSTGLDFLGNDSLAQYYAMLTMLDVTHLHNLTIADYHHWSDDDVYPAQLYLFEILAKLKCSYVFYQ